MVLWQSVNSSLANAIYTHSKVTTWQATIVENTLKRLAALNKPFKYVGLSSSQPFAAVRAVGHARPPGTLPPQTRAFCRAGHPYWSAGCGWHLAEGHLRGMTSADEHHWLAVTCMISQNTGGATHTAHTCFWDAETDGEMRRCSRVACIEKRCTILPLFSLVGLTPFPFLSLVAAAGFTKFRFENQTMVCLTTVYGMGI